MNNSHLHGRSNGTQGLCHDLRNKNLFGKAKRNPL